MKQHKVIKVFLAAGAFLSGLVVAEHLQPISARRGHAIDFDDTLLVAQAEAATATTPTVIHASDNNTSIDGSEFTTPQQVADIAIEPVPRVADAATESVPRPDATPAVVTPAVRSLDLPLAGLAPAGLPSANRPSITDLPDPAYEIQNPLGLKQLTPQFAPLAGPIARLAAKPAQARDAVESAIEAQVTRPAKSDAARQLAAAIDQLLEHAQNVEPTEKVARPGTAPAVRPDERITDKPDFDIEPLDENVRLSPELVRLKGKISEALDFHRYRELNTQEKSAWSIMHSLIAYGVEKKVRVGGTGQRASAIGWICFNNPCRGVRLFYLSRGRIRGQLGPGNQGHEGQFLAMVAQSRVRSDYPMRIEGKQFTIADLVDHEKRSCRARTELTFKLIGLAHYLDIDSEWQNDLGEDWDIPRVIKEEIRQPIVGAACGGTHRLFGLAYAVNRCVHKGHPVTGQFRRAQIYLDEYHKYSFKLQNADGSFSTQFFAGRGAAYDKARRLLTSGHIAEWLSFSLPREELTRPEMIRAMNYLAELLVSDKDRTWEVGPLGHALHALNIYSDRVFRGKPGGGELAARPQH